MLTWDQIYNYLGIRDFIYFISSSSIQDTVFPVKIVFIFFTAFFFCAVIWFYVNSSYIQYKFLQDTTEFLSKETYGLRGINKRFKKIKKRAEGGLESQLKLAIVEADDFLYQNLQNAGFKGEDFEALVTDAAQKTAISIEEVLGAHDVRDAIVYDTDLVLEAEKAKKILAIYENTIKNINIH